MTNIWRKDITGLRALAVVPVLIFHAFPDLLPGGFYGVDIFFVISGYLISGIIFRGLASDKFSFVVFYSRRIKRIVPNLILVIAFVAVIGWFITTASEYVRIAANISHSALFYQNITLMKDEDYFGVLAQNNPLLHIWSLSIEEQFYLLFPFVCFLIWKVGRRSVYGLGVFVLGITAASFVLMLLISDQNVRFYFPLSRFWELGVGICIAYAEVFFKYNTKRYGQTLTNGLSVLGIFLVLLAFFLPTSWYAPPPGAFSLIPVIGGALLILSNANSWVNRTILSWNWVVFIGLISYSLYLWHWPLLAYVRLFFAEPTDFLFLMALVFSFLISVVAYRYVENPMRQLGSDKIGWCIVILLCFLLQFYFLGKVVRQEDGFPDREVARALFFKDDWTYAGGLYKYRDLQDLLVTNPKELPSIVFIGDSHMQQYHSRIIDQAESKHLNVGFVTDGGCMMSLGITALKEKCINANINLSKELSNKQIRTLVITQKWGGYDESLLINGLLAYGNLIDNFKRYDSSRKYLFYWIIHGMKVV